MDCCGALGWLQSSISSLPTCVTGTSGASILPPGVSSGSSTPGVGLQDAPEGGSGACGPTRFRLLQWSVIDLSALNGFVTLTKFQMEMVACLLGFVRKGDWMFLMDLKDVYFQIALHPESWLYRWFCLEGCICQFRALCFSRSTVPQVFTRVFALISEWAHRRSVRLLRYLVIPESRTFPLQHWILVLQLCRDLGIAVNWENSNFQPSTCVQYLGMLIDTSLEKAFPSEARQARFRELATSFLLLPSPPAHMWQQLLGHMASLECFLSLRLLMLASVAVAPQGPLIPHGEQSCRSDPSVPRVLGGSSLVAPGRQVGVRCPSPGSSSVPVAAYQLVSVRVETTC